MPPIIDLIFFNIILFPLFVLNVAISNRLYSIITRNSYKIQFYIKNYNLFAKFYYSIKVYTEDNFL